MVVQLQRRLSGACGGWSWFRASFRCSLSDRTRASKLRAESGTFWVQQSDWRWGGLLLLVGPGGVFREVAGGSGSDSGWLVNCSGGWGVDLLSGRLSDRKLGQLSVVEFVVCGGG